jgi:hypothetical protein
MLYVVTIRLITFVSDRQFGSDSVEKWGAERRATSRKVGGGNAVNPPPPLPRTSLCGLTIITKGFFNLLKPSGNFTYHQV